MKLRLDEYYYILNINYGWEEIEDYMPDDIADKYLEFCESHNSDEVYDYLKRLYLNILINHNYGMIIPIHQDFCNLISVNFKINYPNGLSNDLLGSENHLGPFSVI